MKDIVIIGAGPAGFTAGIYAVRSGMDALLLERRATGGQVLDTDWIENYPGFPGGINGAELMGRFEKHARDLGVSIESDEVHEIRREQDSFVLRTRKGEIKTKTVILATGTGPRPLGVEGEDRLRGKGVSYCAVCDGFFFRDQEVAVVGGGDAAVEEAHFLTRFCSKIYLIHRRDQLRAVGSLQRRALDNPKIEPLWDTVVTEIRGENSVEELILKNTKTGAPGNLKVGGVFIYVGLVANSYLYKGLVELDERGFVKTDVEMGTSVPGLFAAGDVRKTPLRQVVTAVADGAVAAITAEKYITGS
ncbi:MAG: thioredoxin-disulfide reductase [Eubacteriales bacterium]|jgi:thioredoxin reductase (NADPH)|nr:thioredoxin-disulfide reductase [Bacillota bacterium]MBV1726710.1 thioredoxin-disulfide reductase [Desulforudis sp.]MDP3051612.1 thioredoxin-disulfide reductase [Eubacteriales bacterium]MDQ7788836.1 thioredoxin-disulfide reductase [Clostridia bacterium]MBU4533033.1 thioredoxin-disulfide reductase [Bacillota bacterium]